MRVTAFVWETVPVKICPAAFSAAAAGAPPAFDFLRPADGTGWQIESSLPNLAHLQTRPFFLRR